MEPSTATAPTAHPGVHPLPPSSAAGQQRPTHGIQPATGLRQQNKAYLGCQTAAGCRSAACWRQFPRPWQQRPSCLHPVGEAAHLSAHCIASSTPGWSRLIHCVLHSCSNPACKDPGSRAPRRRSRQQPPACTLTAAVDSSRQPAAGSYDQTLQHHSPAASGKKAGAHPLQGRSAPAARQRPAA